MNAQVDLPELPNPDYWIQDETLCEEVSFFSEAQMHAYARAAIAAQVVDAQMVLRACRAYEAEVDGHVHSPHAQSAAMRAALTAALQETNRDR